MASLTSIHHEGTEDNNEGQADPDGPPDGGYGWIIVFCSFVAYSVTSFNNIPVGIFITEFKSVFGWSESELGVLLALRIGLGTLAGLVGGPLTHRFGCRPVALFSIALATLGYILASVSTNQIVIFATFGICCGLGSGISVICSTVIVQQYFVKKRQVAGSLSNAGLSFWSFLSSPISSLLIYRFGWRGAVLMLGGITMQMLVPAAMYRPIKQTITKSTDADKVNTQDNVSTQIPNSNKLCQLAHYFFNRQVLNFIFLLYLVNQWTKSLVVDAFYVRLAPIGLTIGLDPMVSVFLPSVCGLCMLIGRVTGGLLARKLGTAEVYGVCGFISGLSVGITPLLPHNLTSYVIVTVVTGFHLGCALGLQFTWLVNLNGVENLPLSLSWVTLSAGLFRIFSNMAIGRLLDVTGSYSLLLHLAGGLQMMGASCSIAIIFILRKRDRNNKRILYEV